VKKARLFKEKIKCEANERRKFRKDPWAYGTEVLNPPNGGKPQFDVAEAEAHFVPLYEDKNRGGKYGPLQGVKDHLLRSSNSICQNWNGKCLKKRCARNGTKTHQE
jgi:hypothetical protein